tara:strand:- start:236 stop:412 length:177 start_codon:yes stop_codon:yes gene_type:complete
MMLVGGTAKRPSQEDWPYPVYLKEMPIGIPTMVHQRSDFKEARRNEAEEPPAAEEIVF